MDIPAASMVNSTNAVKQTAGIMVLKKAMDSETQNASQLISQMMPTTGATPSPAHLGKNVDVSA